MTPASDAFLVMLILGGYVFHQGGLMAAWQHLEGHIKEGGEKAFGRMLADLKRREQEGRDRWS